MGGAAGSGAGGMGACASNDDCAQAPTGSICDMSTGECVGCLPGMTTCAAGEYCEPTTKQCVNGCADDTGCSAPLPVCDSTTHTCVGCLVDMDCPLGAICGNNSCVPGCSPQHGCPMGLLCCGTTCVNVSTDINHCGACNNSCPNYPNAAVMCVGGICSMGACTVPFANCDQQATNGCEWNTSQGGACVCNPGATRSCYEGTQGTQGVGPCMGGTQTCESTGAAWGACVGQFLPKPELCANGIDEDCNGTVDDSEDADGDGFSRCGGDCCDSPLQGCQNPQEINPGALEIVGNEIDDDCDPATSDMVAASSCSSMAKFTGTSAVEAAQAMGICQMTTSNPPLGQKKWGLINASILLPNGSVPSAAQLTTILGRQIAILTDYGTGGIAPREGTTMVGLSTGYMRDRNDPNCPVEPDTNNGLSSTPPAAYVAAHGGTLPASMGCSGACPSGTGANDGTNLRLTIRTPTNARSLSYQLKYITYEYWMYSCQLYNDVFLALLQTAAPGIPADKNISFDQMNNSISVNSRFIKVCKPQSCYTCPGGTAELTGTGMENQNFGGATNWLATEAPIVPGETIQIEFMTFDVSDNWLDSVVLLDNFKWGVSTTVVNTHE